MKDKRPLLWLFLPWLLALGGCNLMGASSPDSRQVVLDYSWVATTPWAELAGHYDRANVFIAKNYYERQKGYASGEIPPPPHLRSDAYSSHPLAYYTLQRAPQDQAPAEPSTASARSAASAAPTRDSAALHFARGLTYYDLGDFESAIKEFSRAIYLDARHARAYAFRALAYGYTGSAAKAQADLQSAIRLKADPKLITEVQRALQQES